VRFSTEDAAADHRALQAGGVDVDAEIIPYPVPMFTFRDPDGNRLVIVQRPPGR
jgi:predicted enzyme related to lactoylglutathione lyase